MDMTKLMRKQIEDYLAEFNKQKGYAYIFSMSPGLSCIIRTPLYDVTSDLVHGLNEKYGSKKKK